MKRFLLLICLLFLLGACAHEDTTPTESLYIQGDVEVWTDVKELWAELEIIQLSVHEEDNPCLDFRQVLSHAGMIFEENDLFLMADDGFTVRLNDQTIDDTYLMYSSEDGWCYYSDKHPVNSRIKAMNRVVVVGKSIGDYDLNDLGFGFNVISQGRNHFYTRGMLLMSNDRDLLLTDGSANLDGVTMDVMKRHECQSLDDLMTSETDRLILFDEEGGQHYLSPPYGYIETSETHIHYLNGEETVYNVLGLMSDPPPNSIMDNFYDALYYVDKGTPVMTLFLDGFSYAQYERLYESHPDLFMMSLPKAKEALSVYKPVTNAGFTAMITGQLPSVNGIHDRSQREPLVPTIFDEVGAMGKGHGLIEGNTNILKLETSVVMNMDDNDDGLTDDEIMVSAREAIKEEYDYLMVHFHSIDDYGHSYGPYDDRTVHQIMTVDSYVEELVNGWQGMVIITSDHGMHEHGKGGDHGMIAAEDLCVPYFVIDRREE